MAGSDKYVGKILDNRYEILELIGTGGMALVYKARCHRLNRHVAIKILKDDLANDHEFRQRFHTESQTVGMLSHPNIVAVYDVSRSDNIEYIVMELIEGITLKQYINRKGLLNWKEALHFASQVTKALSHAHSRGIIHRDIKPHNIMILKDGSIKVADFGIARLLTMQSTLTQEALGSVHYISPEQAKGGYVDARSDIYSLGVVMYEMLTSRLPFVGESAVSIAIQHISAIPLMPRELNPEIPIGLEDVTMHAMEPDLTMRFTTADEMLNDLEAFRKNPSIIFHYASSEHKDRLATEVIDSQETRIIQPTAVAIPERRVVEQRTGTGPIVRQQAINKKPEMTSDEYRAARKRATSTSTLVGIFFIVLFLVAVVVFMWNYLLKDIFSTRDREQIEIPAFVNRVYEDIIRDELYGELFNFRPPVYEHSDEFAEGLVISQSPAVGTTFDAPLPGNKVNIELVVSQGEEPTIMMPELLDLHFRIARNVLDGLRMDLEIIEEPVASEVEIGYVINTIPESGEQLARGNSVTIMYSGGLEVEYRVVPDLVGSTKAQVESAFSSQDITPSYMYFNDESPADTVLFIERADQRIAVPATIVVHISLGPPYSPEPSEPPEQPSTDQPTEPLATDPNYEQPWTDQPSDTEPPYIPPDDTEPPYIPPDDTEPPYEPPEPDAGASVEP